MVLYLQQDNTKLMFLHTYVLRLGERSESMSDYRQGKGLLGPMYIMWGNISHKRKNTH